MTLMAALSCLAMVAPAHAEKTTGESVDDTALSGEVKAMLIDTKGVPSTAINVEVDKGVVQLGGFIESEAERTASLEAARRVKGVTKVLDALVVIKKDRSTGQAIDDTTIQSKLKSALASETSAGKAWDINTDVYAGEVLLSGFIHGEKSRAKAGEIASGLKGVKKVYNNIEVTH
jgi:osmotically-inducible protein OsmY